MAPDFIGPEFGKRVRAARAYAGFDQPTVGRFMATSHNWVRSVENGEKEMTRGQVIDFADRCGLPEVFFTVDWSALGGSHDDRLDNIERAITELATTLQSDRPAGSPEAQGGRTSPVNERA